MYDNIPHISVCIATYNGERYIKEQLASILDQLSSNDEIVISDDCSTDRTVDIIDSLKDKRIKIFVNDRTIGYILNFEKAITLSSGQYIFLSDQDDIWPHGRLIKMIDVLRFSQKLVVVGNMEIFYDNLSLKTAFKPKIYFRYNRCGLLNILKMLRGGIPYFGCCMGFHCDIKKYYLPFLDKNISHDIWLSLLGNYLNQIAHIENIVLYRRIHGNNITTSKRSFFAKTKTRFDWTILIFRIWIKFFYNDTFSSFSNHKKFPTHE